MKNVPLYRRVLSVILVVALLSAYLVPVASAAENTSTTESLSFTKVETGVSVPHAGVAENAETLDAEHYAMNDVVRVSIFLEKASTIGAGYSTEGVAQNASAMAYRETLKNEQAAVTSKIEAAIGSKLEVKWNLTLAANIISANVAYGDIAAIEAVPGVACVEIENCYEPAVVSKDETADPNMATSCFMIGSNVAWANGYTGAGSKVAVIDTGIDTDHQSFDGEAWEYAMAENAEKAGMTVDEYKASVGVLTAADVAAVADQLNVTVNADTAYLTGKIPFAYNYVDGNYTVDHDHDSQGEHGSHVEGIAAANKYIPSGDGFVAALDSVAVQGVAPDAQIVTMKVFGAKGGAYDSDYMAAIEDAIVLGCDSANLSLGSGSAGFATSGGYQDVMNSLTENGTVVAISAGNAYAWNSTPYGNMPGYLYSDDVSMDTVGSPGSFTNSLSVASVDNTGNSGMPLKFGDLNVFYSESTGYTNPPIAATIPGVNEYVIIAGDAKFAVDGSGNNLLTPFADVIAGKVVLVSRGTSSFYQKMDAAAEVGASACIVVNNQPGVINMDLSSATSEIPCVSITLADGEAITAASTPVTDDEGNVLYYTGSVTVTDQIEAVPGDPDAFKSISEFSSWGVPGSLTMKPEISAPGGSIYSVNGAEAGGKGYELMSGTSMAAPQVAGMAGVMGQYIREAGLVEKTGLTARQLINSLLMSTAVPMMEDFGEYGYGYFPIIRQGSGLANVGAAVSANSYILMGEDATASYADGKVKVELGEDADREGVYEYTFTINNLDGEEHSYTLSADFFTQDLTSDGTHLYMDTWTAMLAADVVFTVDGETFVPTFAAEIDVDGDGDTDADDAQMVLNYVVGLIDEIAPCADVDGDGKVTSADAYAILNSAETASFTVPADGSVTVKVTASLDENDKAYLDTYYNGGAYVQGYTYVTPVTTEEGEVTDVEHSIPVLGFYGSWTDASMFDNTSIVDVTYGTNDKVSYTGNTATNGLYVRYGSDTTNYWFLGNPYVTEESFPADRLAVGNNVNLYQFRYNLIRNAAAVAAVITSEDGEVLWASSVTNNATAAYYYVNGSQWQNRSTSSFNVNKAVSALGLAEGEKFTVGLYAIPEYYAEGHEGAVPADRVKALVSEGKLGDGASISYTFAYDNTAPELTAITRDLISGDITVTAKDDNYVAAVMVANASGTKIYGASLPEQDAPNQETTTPIDLEGINLGQKALIIVADYAGNETSYEVELSTEPVSYDGNMYGFTAGTARGSGNRWIQIDPTTLWMNKSSYEGEGMDVVSSAPFKVTAAEYVDGYVFMATDGALYVAAQGDWTETMKVASCSVTINDMAYNYADETLYALDNANGIWTVDTTTGAMEKVADVTITNPKSTSASYLQLVSMTIDDDGNFYFSNYGNSSYVYLYKMTLDDVVDAAVTLNPVNNASDGGMYTSGYSLYNRYSGSMAWDHDHDVLYMATAYNQTKDYDSRLYIVDVETGKASLTTTYNGPAGTTSDLASSLGVCVTGLYIVPTTSGAPVVSAPSSIELSEKSLTLLQGSTATLTADVYPWNLEEKSVTWTSSDETVVTVDNGKLTTLSAGTATITATTVATPALSASCEVIVEPVPVASMSGLVYAVDGTPIWSDFSTDDLATRTELAEGSTYIAGALSGDVLYVCDTDNLYAVDADTFEVTLIGSMEGYPFCDVAGIPESVAAAYGAHTLGLGVSGTWILMDNQLSGWNMTSVLTEPMAAIAYVGPTSYSGDEAAQLYYMLTEGGQLWSLTLYGGSSMARIQVGVVDIDLTGVSAADGTKYASMLFDNETGYLFLSTYLDGNTAQMYAINPETMAIVLAGEFEDGVWPAVALYQYTRATELALKVTPASVEMFVGDTAELSATVKPAAFVGGVTFATDDESVAAVSDDGVVTAVAPGTANITVTTVDVNAAGEHVSVVVPVLVKDMVSVDATIGLQIVSDYNNDVAETLIVDLSDLSTTTVKTDELAYDAGGVAGGERYGMYGNYFVVDADGSGYNFATYPNYIAVDMANSPAFSTFACAAIYPSTTNYLVRFDAVAGSISSWNLSSAGMNLCGMAFAGYFEDEDGVNLTYYALGADGKVYIIYIYEGDTEGSLKLSRTAIGDLGMSFDAAKTSLGYYWDGEDDGVQGLVIADGTNMTLYWTDLTADTLMAGALGTLEGELVSSLYGAFDFASTTSGTENTNLPAKHVGTTSESKSLMALTAETVSLKPVNETVGSTNMIHGAAALAVLDHKGADATVESGVVTLTLTEDVAVNNGLIEVEYDPAVLTFTGASSLVSNFAVNTSEGKVVFAYATKTAVQPAEALAQLTFTYEGEIHTTVEITTLERNADVAVSEEPTVVEIDSDHVCPSAQFTDVDPEKWYHEGIDFMVKNGYMAGTSDTEFGVNNRVTRAQFVTVLYSVAGKPSVEGIENPFEDVADGKWYTDAILWAVSEGITGGTSETTFSPNANVSRAQIAMFLYTYAGKPAVEGDFVSNFNDVSDIPSYAKDAMNWAVSEGIMSGTSDGNLFPRTVATRAQVATMIYALLSK